MFLDRSAEKWIQGETRKKLNVKPRNKINKKSRLVTETKYPNTNLIRYPVAPWNYNDTSIKPVRMGCPKIIIINQASACARVCLTIQKHLNQTWNGINIKMKTGTKNLAWLPVWLNQWFGIRFRPFLHHQNLLLLYHSFFFLFYWPILNLFIPVI